MKKVLVVHHAHGVNEFQINDFIAQIPEQHRIGYEIKKNNSNSFLLAIYTQRQLQ